MGKAGTLLRIIKKLIREPKSIARIFDDSEIWTRKGYEKGLPTVDILDLLPNRTLTVHPYSFLYGTSLPIDMALLRALASRFDECKYIEIGTWRGESAVNVADFTSECYTVDLSADEMKRRGFSREYIEATAFFSNGDPRITHIRQDSRTLDPLVIGKFDLIFIDGDHSYKGIKADTQLAFQLLKDSSSIIVWHDYGTGPERVCWKTLAAILDGSPPSSHKKIYHVSNTMCAAYLPYSYPTSYPPFPQIPNKKFRIAIDVSKIEED